MELLRFATAGSVDDGKSTLIGRLLHDSKSIFTDQLDAVRRTSAQRGDEFTNLALLTDGLRAEREQGITIDVAYRYFATPARKFIIADTPGHVQYTRNMVTGASTADLALVLVDARNGLLEQSRRHACIASLLRVPHLVLCVNKMDLVGYSATVFGEIEADFRAFCRRLDVPEVTAIPVSALHGDNVVDPSPRMPWYDGPALLDHLETVEVTRTDHVGGRFPVQYVIRPMSQAYPDYRGYAGQVAAGTLRAGDEVIVLPAGRRTTIAGIDTFDGPLAEATAPMSVTLRLADSLDVGRGDLVCVAGSEPAGRRELDVTVCWLAEAPLRAGARLTVKHTTRTTRGIVAALGGRLDVTTLERHPGEELALNDIGQARLRLAAPLFADGYGDSRTTGALILVDETTGATVGAGMISAGVL